MASKVEICNMALQRVAADRITSLTDNTEAANACASMYDLIADEVMSIFPWSTCVRRASLARLATTPSFGYDYQFQLPVDPACLRVLEVNSEFPSEIDYAIEGDKLLTDETTIKIRYIARLTDPGSYGPYLTQAIYTKLALALANKFQSTASLLETLRAEYNDVVGRAIATDNTQGSVRYYTNNDVNRTRD